MSNTALLLTAISDIDTTLSLSSNTLFPAVAGKLIIGSEAISYASRYMDTYYGCTRGVDSTTPAAHAIGVTATLVDFYAAGSLDGALNANNLTSGTVPNGRFPATLPVASGVNLTALNASNLGSGTVPDARFPATLPAASGINLTALNATNLGSGTVPDARFPAVLPAVSGANLTNLPGGAAALVTSSGSAVGLTNGQYTNVTSIILGAGKFLLFGTGFASGSSATQFNLAISAFSGNTTTDHVLGFNVTSEFTVGGANTGMAICGWPITSVGGTYYLKILPNSTGTSGYGTINSIPVSF